MPEPFRLSVVIVVRNALPALRQSIASLQTLADPRISLVVVDGASTDGTAQYLDELSGVFPALQWLSERDRGIYDAMNKGWDRVPADDFVLYLGAGDKLLALPSSDALRDATHGGVDILIGRCLHGERSIESEWCETLYFGNTIHHQALMVRRSLHLAPPFDTSFKAYGDWEFNVRLFKQGHRARQLPGFTTYADPGGVTQKIYLGEACRIGFRHGGLRALVRAYRRHAPIRFGQLKARFRR